MATLNKINGEWVTTASGQRMWVGTQAAYEAALANGEIAANTLVAITDDSDSNIDDVPTANSENLVKSGGVYDAIYKETRQTITVSWGAGMSSTVGDTIYYYPKSKRLYFPSLGGSQTGGTNIQVEQSLCSITIPSRFSVPGYGITIPMIVRNSSSGATVPALASLNHDGSIVCFSRTITDGTYNEFRILGASVFSSVM